MVKLILKSINGKNKFLQFWRNNMLNIIAALVATAVSFAWFWPGIRAQKNNKVLKKKDYIQTALIYGLLFTCGLIIVTEITYDIIAKHM